MMTSRLITDANIQIFRKSLIEKERSAATISKYLRDIRGFAVFTGGRPISKELTIQYKRYLLERYAPSSVNSMLAALNCFFREMEWYDCTVKAVRIQQQSFREKERELSKAEYFRLLEEANRRKNTRLCLLMQTICATGIRVSELQFITVGAASRGRAVVSLKGKVRHVLIPTALCLKLKQYAKEQGIISGSIFVTKSGRPIDRSNILHDMKRLCKAAGVEKQKVFPHNLRHLFATLYYASSKDMGRLADILGHVSMNTTRIYTSVSGAQQRQEIGNLNLIL